MKNLSNQTRLEIDETSTNRKYWDEKAKEIEFKDIRNFLGYFETHTQTERALFSGQHTEFILALKRYSQEERKKINPFNSFQSIGPSFYGKMKTKVNSLQ